MEDKPYQSPFEPDSQGYQQQQQFYSSQQTESNEHWIQFLRSAILLLLAVSGNITGFVVMLNQPLFDKIDRRVVWFLSINRHFHWLIAYSLHLLVWASSLLVVSILVSFFTLNVMSLVEGCLGIVGSVALLGGLHIVWEKYGEPAPEAILQFPTRLFWLLGFMFVLVVATCFAAVFSLHILSFLWFLVAGLVIIQVLLILIPVISLGITAWLISRRS